MRFVSHAVLMALVAAGSGLCAWDASAQQESFTQQIEDLRNAVGMAKERPPIDYTDRPPIVVPPTYTLPPPGHGDPEHLDVNDPDLAARRKALSDSRRPVPPTDPGAKAAGRDARTYLIDPPSGLRNPDAVAADITHGGAAPAAPAPKHVRAHKKKLDQASE